MTNHPNRKHLYTVAIQSWSNSGLGWELIPNDKGGVDAHHDVTREQAVSLTANRADINLTSVDVYRGDGDLVGNSGREDTKLHWI